MTRTGNYNGHAGPASLKEKLGSDEAVSEHYRRVRRAGVRKQQDAARRIVELEATVADLRAELKVILAGRHEG